MMNEHPQRDNADPRIEGGSLRILLLLMHLLLSFLSERKKYHLKLT